jgi:hypothetical protein
VYEINNLFPYTSLIKSTDSAAVLPRLKQNLMFSVTFHSFDNILSLPSNHGAVFPFMLSGGRCGVARLQNKFGHIEAFIAS